MPAKGTRPREDPIRLRDAALIRISRTRRWMIVGAAALTAGLAALVSAILPGKSLGAKSTAAAAPVAHTAATTRPAVTPPLPAPASAAQLGVGSAGASSESIPPPPAPPQPAPEASPTPAPAETAPAPSSSAAVSGGS